MDPPAELAPTPMETEALATEEATGASENPSEKAASTPEKSAEGYAAMEEDNPASTPATEDENGSEDDTSSTASSDAAFSPSEDPTENLTKATTLKDEGNDQFKTGDLDKASRSYRKGINRLKPLNKNNTGDEQVKALLISLQNNLSMVLFKQNKHRQSRDVAGKVLKVDDKNVKALYRRALAQRQMGDLDEARADLKEALKHDANNTAVKKELVTIKKEIERIKATQKKGLQKAFSSGAGGGLYDDKEAEKREKEEQKRRKKEEEAKAKEKRKEQWEDECVSRMAKNEPAISFEDWEKEQEEAVKKQQKEEEEKREEEKRARAQARKAAAAAKKQEDSDSDDDKLTS